jgi:hypothetical protein
METNVMKRNSILVASMVAITLAVAAAPVLAQQRGSGWGMPGWGMMDRDRQMGPGGMMGGCAMVGSDGQGSAFIDGRIAFLKAELAISDSQKGAWDAYASATKLNLQSMQGMWQTMQTVNDAKTPVERLDAQLVAMESRTKALNDLKPALAKLYEALSAVQKKSADEILTSVGCMM